MSLILRTWPHSRLDTGFRLVLRRKMVVSVCAVFGSSAKVASHVPSPSSTARAEASPGRPIFSKPSFERWGAQSDLSAGRSSLDVPFAARQR